MDFNGSTPTIIHELGELKAGQAIILDQQKEMRGDIRELTQTVSQMKGASQASAVSAAETVLLKIVTWVSPFLSIWLSMWLTGSAKDAATLLNLMPH